MHNGDGDTNIYTDGACSPNPGPGGYGVVLLAGGHRQELSGGFRKTTNNRMELISVIRALEAVQRSSGKVTVYSDAQYVVSMYNGGHASRWRRDGWRRNRGKDPALNSDLWGRLLDLCEPLNVEFIWVRGHADNVENMRCDDMAVAARLQNDLPVDEGYEAPIVAAAHTQLSLFAGL